MRHKWSTTQIRIKCEVMLTFLGWMHVLTSTILPLILLISYYASFVASNVLFGFKTKGAAYLSTGSTISLSVTMKSDFNWVRKLDRCLVGMAGSLPDCEELFAILEGECSIHGLDYQGRSLSSKAIASFCRHQLLTKPLAVRIMVAGFEKSLDDEVEGIPKLFWVDETAALQDVSYAAHGEETPFLLSMLDQNRHLLQQDDTISSNAPAHAGKLEDGSLAFGGSPRGHGLASRVARQCWSQLRKRSAGRIDTSTARLFCVDKDGVQELGVDCSGPLR